MGLALVAYYRSMFIDLGAEASTLQLRSAMTHIYESLSIRQRLAGPLENETTARTANVAAKIMLALLRIEGGPGRSREQEAITEFYRERSLHMLHTLSRQSVNTAYVRVGICLWSSPRIARCIMPLGVRVLGSERIKSRKIGQVSRCTIAVNSPAWWTETAIHGLYLASNLLGIRWKQIV
jgi:hypothetical protein